MCADYRQIARSHRGAQTARESTSILPTLQTPVATLEANFTPIARTSAEASIFADVAARAKLILPEIEWRKRPVSKDAAQMQDTA